MHWLKELKVLSNLKLKFSDINSMSQCIGEIVIKGCYFYLKHAHNVGNEETVRKRLGRMAKFRA